MSGDITFGIRTAGVLEKLTASQESLAHYQEILNEVLRDAAAKAQAVADHLATRPQPPVRARAESDSAFRARQTAHTANLATWTSEQDALENALASLNTRVEDLGRSIALLMQGIERASTIEMAQAGAADRQDAQTYFDSVRQQLETSLGTSESAENEDVKVETKRIEIRHGEIVAATLLVPQLVAATGRAAAGAPPAALDERDDTPKAALGRAVARDSGIAADDGGVAEASIRSLPPELATSARALQRSFTTEITSALASGARSGAAAPSGGLGGAVSTELQSRWADLVASLAERGPVDIAAYVQFVLRESYNSTTQDLYFYAEKVKFFNDLKKMIREEVRQARTALSDLKNGDTSAMTPSDGAYWYSGKEFTYDHITTDENGNPSPEVNQKWIGPLRTAGDNATKQLEDYISGLDKDLQAVGDDAQLANVDLQNILQKQQQTLQLMSNVSKMLHDTALSIIRKIAG